MTNGPEDRHVLASAVVGVLPAEDEAGVAGEHGPKKGGLGAAVALAERVTRQAVTERARQLSGKTEGDPAALETARAQAQSQ